MNEEINLKPWLIGGGLIALLILFLIVNPFVTIAAGYRGVVLNFGAVTGEVRGEGLSFRMPFVQSVKKMNVQVNRQQVKIEAASKDLQTVDSEIALNYHLDPNKVASVYQKLGLSYADNIIYPSLSESVKAATAQYTAEELITKRDSVGDAIKTNMISKMNNNGIMIDDINIVNFNFSKSFNEAIEAKVSTEQNALAAKNKLEQVKYEAEQTIAKAEGEAKAIKIQTEAINSQGGENYVNMKAVEHWDGKLPVYMMGNSVPFINLK